MSSKIKDSCKNTPTWVANSDAKFSQEETYAKKSIFLKVERNDFNKGLDFGARFKGHSGAFESVNFKIPLKEMSGVKYNPLHKIDFIEKLNEKNSFQSPRINKCFNFIEAQRQKMLDNFVFHYVGESCDNQSSPDHLKFNNFVEKKSFNDSVKDSGEILISKNTPANDIETSTSKC
jgi:hypothetical protein